MSFESEIALTPRDRRSHLFSRYVSIPSRELFGGKVVLTKVSLVNTTHSMWLGYKISKLVD